MKLFAQYIIILFIIVIFPQFSFAGEAYASNENNYKPVPVELNLNYLKGYYYDTKSIILSPLHWDNKDWLIFSAITSSALLLSTEDENIRTWVQSSRYSVSDNIASFAKPFGNGRYTLPVSLLMYVYGKIFDNYKFRRAALLSVESFIISGVFNMSIKFLFNRERPVNSIKSDVIHGPFSPIFSPSFPSGHSQAVWSIATVFATEFSDTVIIPVFAYGIATLTALSRVNDNKHWTSDIIIGSSIGFFTAKAIENNHLEKSNNIILFPEVSKDTTSLTIKYLF